MKLVEIFLGVIAVSEVCMFLFHVYDFCLGLHYRKMDIKNAKRNLELNEQSANIMIETKKQMEKFTYNITMLDLRIKALEEKQPKE